jgi:hypothetical protein
MEYEKKHYAYRPTIGGSSVSTDKLINDLKEKAIYYIGTFREYNPIGYQDGIAAIVRKETTKSVNQQKDFNLPGFKLKRGMGYHGTDFNNNKAISFSKQDLLRIANAMDDTDDLWISVPDYGVDVTKLTKGINEVCKL